MVKKLSIKETNNILKKLNNYGFNVTEPAGYGNYGVNLIDKIHFNEKVNEALSNKKPHSRL